MAAAGKNNQDPNWGRIASIGMEVAVGVGLGALIGAWIDSKYKTDPWGLMIGTGIGFAAGIYLLLKEAIAVNKSESEKSAARRTTKGPDQSGAGKNDKSDLPKDGEN